MIFIKSPREIEYLRQSNAIVAEVLRMLRWKIMPGVTTEELDQVAEKLITSMKALPAFKGYQGFPASLCVSINEEVVHGIPSKRELKEGDLVGLDVGVNLNGYFGDGAITLPVGEVDEGAGRLLEVTKNALYIGIENAVAGNSLFNISNAIQTWVENRGFSVVRDFGGHGIGKNLHEEPLIPNFSPPHNRWPILKEGMVLSLEPMVNEGTYKVRTLTDGWTVVTADGKRSAHFEHTVAITHEGVEILSL